MQIVKLCFGQMDRYYAILFKGNTGATANNVSLIILWEDASYLRIQNIQLGYTLNLKYKIDLKLRL
jgi:hypothetical protein